MAKSLAMLAVLLLPYGSFALKDTSSILKAQEFAGWLESHRAAFANCDLSRDGDNISLCDGTRVDMDEIKALFASSPAAALEEMKAKGIRVEILCDVGVQVFSNCSRFSNRKSFEEVTSLHGKYLPTEDTILIRSTSTIGTLVHEYIHALQTQNRLPVFGRVYKRDRVKIQAELDRIMKEKIRVVTALERANRKAEILPHLQEFTAASSALRAFAPWQDLIDERSIFLLYLKFGKELGIPEADLALAKKNMGFICASQKMGPLLPKSQCS